MSTAVNWIATGVATLLELLEFSRGKDVLREWNDNEDVAFEIDTAYYSRTKGQLVRLDFTQESGVVFTDGTALLIGAMDGDFGGSETTGPDPARAAWYVLQQSRAARPPEGGQPA